MDEVAIAATTQIGDQGLTIGRAAAVLAGLPKSVPGYAIDRMCAGAMTAVTTVAGGISFGAYDVAIAGGVEHMGRHPMGEGVDPNPRFLSEQLVDGSALVMGMTAENLHDRYPSITKERADAFAVASQEKAAKAYADGKIQRDLVPMATRKAAEGWGLATVDEPPRPGTTMEGLRGLKTPSGRTGGSRRATPPASTTARPAASWPPRTWPASSASPRACGWCRTPSPASTPRSWASGRSPPPSALRLAGLSIGDIGLIEINEAYAVQVLAFLEHFGIADDDPRVNPYGGAIAFGHPLASSGVRLMTHLSREFAERPDVRYGITTMCVGMGMGGTVIWENLA